MRVVVAGGSGFLGSHLCEALLNRGDSVCCLDDFSSGRAANIAHLTNLPGFACIPCDVTARFRVFGNVDAVVHLASPASPRDHRRHPLRTLAAGSRGTENLLNLAVRHGARFVLASSGDVYGAPLEHPQDEDCWGHVNPIGPRSAHDEAQRYAEALATAYRHSRGADVGIVRIFTTYGPRMRANDGRVVSTFIRQALAEEPLTVHGDGSQTRSLCYVDDMVRGLTAMMDSPHPGPFNLGSPGELTVRELAEQVLLITGSHSFLKFLPLPVDDPVRRRPVIARAREGLGWQPAVLLDDGLRRTVDWFAAQHDTLVRPPERRPEAETRGEVGDGLGVPQ